MVLLKASTNVKVALPPLITKVKVPPPRKVGGTSTPTKRPDPDLERPEPFPVRVPSHQETPASAEAPTVRVAGPEAAALVSATASFSAASLG